MQIHPTPRLGQLDVTQARQVPQPFKRGPPHRRIEIIQLQLQHLPRWRHQCTPAIRLFARRSTEHTISDLHEKG